MSLQSALLKNLNIVEPLKKKQRMTEGTPLKHFLTPIMEEAMKRRIMGMSQQMPQLGQESSGMIEPPSVNPLENALMSMGQGGSMPSPQGGMSNGT